MALKGNTAEEKVWNFLYEKIGNAYAVAGIMGNLYAESGIIFDRVELLCLKRLKENGKNYTKESYTADVDSGKISKATFLNPLPSKQYGYGLAQWTSHGRKAKLYDLCKSRKVSIADEQAQLDHLWTELNGDYKNVLNAIKNAKNVKEASDVVLTKFEMPADCGATMKATRAKYGFEYYDKYAKNASQAPTTDIVQMVRNDAVDFAVNIANDNSHGYSQAVRSLYNITDPKSFDCSSLVLTAYYYAFLKNGLKKQAEYLKQNCSYTGNMLSMQNVGFEIVATNQTAHAQMIKGDVELNVTYHTALAIDKDNIVHARTSEGTSDTKDGSGNEIRSQAWYQYSHGWTHRLRFTGKNIDMSSVSHQTVSIPTSSSVLKRGSKGNEVKTMQAMLITIGYSCGVYKADGDFGSDTEKALKTFQADYGLEVDGIYGKNSGSKLEEIYKKKITSNTPDKFMVKVTANDLNVRTGPSTSYTVSGHITDKGCYTIVEESGNLGKLLSGMGWICLDYTKRL